jgi:hypothetical protein
MLVEFWRESQMEEHYQEDLDMGGILDGMGWYGLDRFGSG